MPQYPGYEQLQCILRAALEQAAVGKGHERHATGQTFENQPMQLISQLLGDNHGLAFQAVKKIQESLRLSPDRAEHELLGAINYIAGMIIYLRETAKPETSTVGKDYQGFLQPGWDRAVPVIHDVFLAKLKTRVEPDATAVKVTTTRTNDAIATDTVPLKQYNELLAQYTQLEKRVLTHK